MERIKITLLVALMFGLILGVIWLAYFLFERYGGGWVFLAAMVGVLSVSAILYWFTHDMSFRADE